MRSSAPVMLISTSRTACGRPSHSSEPSRAVTRAVRRRSSIESVMFRYESDALCESKPVNRPSSSRIAGCRSRNSNPIRYVSAAASARVTCRTRAVTSPITSPETNRRVCTDSIGKDTADSTSAPRQLMSRTVSTSTVLSAAASSPTSSNRSRPRRSLNRRYQLKDRPCCIISTTRARRYGAWRFVRPWRARQVPSRQPG